MKDKKFLILIVINIGIIIGLIVTGFILYSKYLKIVSPLAPPISPVVSPGQIVDPEIFIAQFEDCLAGKLTPPLNPKINWHDAIYTLIEALSRRNEKSCLKLEEEKDLCLQYFFVLEALTKKNIEYCKKLDPLAHFPTCLAVIKEDVSYCEKIKNSLSKEICLAISKPEHCDYLSGTFDVAGHLLRVESYGIEGNKIKREEKGEIEEEEAKSLCRKNVYFVKALKEQNPVICNLPEIKKDNFTMLICEILSTPEPEKTWQNLRQKICYEKFGPTLALLKNDSSFCEKIPFKDTYNQGVYNFCLSQVK